MFSVIQVLVVLLVSAAIVAHKSVGLEVIVGELVVAAILALRAFYRHRFYREASAYVGVKVNWYRPIPIPRQGLCHLAGTQRHDGHETDQGRR